MRLIGLALIAVALLSGCAAVAPEPTTPASPTSVPPQQLHILTNPALILAALPPDVVEGDIAAPPAPADPAELAIWADPAARWRELAQQAARLDVADDEGLQAALSTLDAALHDGLVLAEAARAAGHAVSDDAVIAELAWRIIAQAHPLRADTAREAAETAAWASYWRGEASASGVITGRALGATVAAAQIAVWQTNSASAAR